jgi:hypothetical protein
VLVIGKGPPRLHKRHVVRGVGAGRRGMIVTGAKASSPRRLALLPAPPCPMVGRKRARQAGDEVLVIGKGPPRLSRPYKMRRGQMDDVMAELNEALVV